MKRITYINRNLQHLQLSASSAHRWLACPPSAAAAVLYPEQDSASLHEEMLAHKVAMYAAKGSEISMETFKRREMIVTPEMIACAKDYAAYITGLRKSEDAVMLLGQPVDFTPWVPEGIEACDCILIQNNTLILVEYVYSQDKVLSAVDNPQMKLYALGALNDYGFDLDVTEIELHVCQPRLNSISVDTLSPDELVAWGEETVKPIAQNAVRGEGSYRPGAQCQSCQHVGRCRALTEVCTEYVESHGFRLSVPVLTPGQMADILKMTPLIELWLKKVNEQALSALMEGGEIPGYKVIEGRPGHRKWTDEREVAHALHAAGYCTGDFTETKLLSPVGMDKAIGKRKVAELLKQMIARSPGAPTVVPDTDRRPVYKRGTKMPDNLCGSDR